MIIVPLLQTIARQSLHTQTALIRGVFAIECLLSLIVCSMFFAMSYILSVRYSKHEVDLADFKPLLKLSEDQ